MDKFSPVWEIKYYYLKRYSSIANCWPLFPLFMVRYANQSWIWRWIFPVMCHYSCKAKSYRWECLPADGKWWKHFCGEKKSAKCCLVWWVGACLHSHTLVATRPTITTSHITVPPSSLHPFLPPTPLSVWVSVHFSRMICRIMESHHAAGLSVFYANRWAQWTSGRSSLNPRICNTL